MAAVTKRERGGSALLWAGVLTGPAAWSLQILVGYNLEEIACRAGSTEELILGADIEAIVIWLTVGLTAITLASGLLALGCYRRIAVNEADVTKSRARWMARAGLIVSGLFSFMLLLGLFLPLYFGVCEPPL